MKKIQLEKDSFHSVALLPVGEEGLTRGIEQSTRAAGELLPRAYMQPRALRQGSVSREGQSEYFLQVS
jgi:hypothetical protein